MFEFVLLLGPYPARAAAERLFQSHRDFRFTDRFRLAHQPGTGLCQAINGAFVEAAQPPAVEKIPSLCIAWAKASRPPTVVRYEPAHPSEGEILFDLHGEWAQKPENQRTLAQLKYYQPYGSTSPTGLLLNGLNNVSPEMRDWMVGEFLEAAWTAIAVIDERVQQQAMRPSDSAGRQPMWKTYRRMRLFVPTTEIDLNRQTLTEQDETDLLHWLKTLLDHESLNFVVIHLEWWKN
jgi:hypothetical protein